MLKDETYLHRRALRRRAQTHIAAVPLTDFTMRIDLAGNSGPQGIKRLPSGAGGSLRVYTEAGL
ncbi:MAG: hypothetical protein L0Y57_09595 [Beijerinckiaceae bacterium]|nr:hypothetical protein [Beijerinckiaceae bacterium]